MMFPKWKHRKKGFPFLRVRNLLAQSVVLLWIVYHLFIFLSTGLFTDYSTRILCVFHNYDNNYCSEQPIIRQKYSAIAFLNPI